MKILKSVIAIQSILLYLYLPCRLNLLNFHCLGNVVMGLFMAIIALILDFIFKYARVIFDAETLNGLKELGITML